jgi:hypothetical protein
LNAIIVTLEAVRTRVSTQEALITFAVPLENAATISHFIGKVGHQFGAAFSEVGAKEKPEHKKPHGEAARQLKLSGFFRMPQVWEVIGTDDEFRAWVQRQPSAWSGDYSEYVNGEGRCEAAHVSRIEYGRGVGLKPKYACIPLTHDEHMRHHAKGESVFDRYLDEHDSDAEHMLAESGRQWMERMRIKYVERWAWDTLKIKFNADSFGDVSPLIVINWAKEFHVEQFLPHGYGA